MTSNHMRGRKPDPVPISGAIRSIPRAPAEMSKEAKAEWKRCMAVLVDRGVLLPADIAAVERYCEACGDIKIARAAIAKDGAYVKNRLDELKRHPAFATLREATAEARRWAAELGLTPASRGRVATNEDDDDNKMDL